MNIIRINTRVGFKEFSDLHNLELKITERSELANLYGKYCANWNRAVISKQNYTQTCVGDGSSEKEAADNYIKKISGTFIILYNESFTEHKEIMVPPGLYNDFEAGELK